MLCHSVYIFLPVQCVICENCITFLYKVLMCVTSMGYLMK